MIYISIKLLMRKLRAWDPVIVIAWKYKGKISTIQKFVGEDRAIVKGINEVKKAMKGKGFIKKILDYSPVLSKNILIMR